MSNDDQTPDVPAWFRTLSEVVFDEATPAHIREACADAVMALLDLRAQRRTVLMVIDSLGRYLGPQEAAGALRRALGETA